MYSYVALGIDELVALRCCKEAVRCIQSSFDRYSPAATPLLTFPVRVKLPNFRSFEISTRTRLCVSRDLCVQWIAREEAISNFATLWFAAPVYAGPWVRARLCHFREARG